jgi:hypothetical protein
MWSGLGELPRELWTANVLPLLALNDLVRVDTAIASKIGREEFSALLKDHHVQFDDSKLIGDVAGAFRWTHVRCLHVDTVKIGRHHCNALRTADQVQQRVGSIFLSFSDVVEGMDDGLHHISSNTLSCVHELYFGPYKQSSGHSSIDEDGAVAETVRRFPGLKKLTIEVNSQLGPQICQALTLRGKLLDEFSLVASAVPDAAYVISTAANACPQLRKFTLDYNVTHQPPTSASLALMARQCPLLEELVVISPGEYMAGSAAEVITAANNLTKLCCSELVLDAAAMSAWVRTKRNLIDVALSWDLYAKDVSASAVDALARVRELSIHNVSGTCGLQKALRFTTGLRGLFIEMEESSEVPLPLTVITQLAETCSELTHVELFSCGGLDDGDAVDAAFAALARHNRDLLSLTVATCDYIGDRTVLAIAAHCPQFRELEVTHGLLLTDDTLLALVRGCGLLTTVASSNDVSDVTEAGLVAVAHYGHACLETLCLRTSYVVSDATRELLRERCPKLRLHLIHEETSSSRTTDESG